jgi:hypothetical protein
MIATTNGIQSMEKVRMLTKEDLIIGKKYLCNANDIITSWPVELTWIGNGWSHESQNIEGYYPAIVHEIIKAIK